MTTGAALPGRCGRLARPISSAAIAIVARLRLPFALAGTLPPKEMEQHSPSPSPWNAKLSSALCSCLQPWKLMGRSQLVVAAGKAGPASPPQVSFGHGAR